MYQICPSHVKSSMGKFVYGQNKLNGFALVTVNEKKIEIKLKGVEGTDEISYAINPKKR